MVGLRVKRENPVPNIHSVVVVRQVRPQRQFRKIESFGLLVSSVVWGGAQRSERTKVTKARSSKMERRMTKRAIVLAAGTGSRLGEPQIDLPKPLRRVAGVPLLVRVLRTLQSVGIREAVVVTGFEGDRVRRALMSEPSLGLNLLFANNDQYLKKNGVSLLAAA